MSKRYRLVVFDWEGTLSDTIGQILNSVAEEAKQLGLGELDEELARQSVELGLVNAIKKVFPNLNLQQHEALLNAVQHSLMTRHNDVYLMPGALELLTRLQDAGVHLAVASNKGQQSLQRALQQSGLDLYIKEVRCAGPWAPKPDPEMLEDILEHFGVTPDEALMIGDSVTDIYMAGSLNVDAVGVNFYNQQDNALLAAGALTVCHSYSALSDFLSATL